MRYFRRQLSRWIAAWISILILMPLPALAQGQSGKASKQKSPDIVEKCRYNERNEYVCEDVIVRPPSQKQDVPKPSTPNVAQTAPSTGKTLNTSEEKKKNADLKDLEYDVLVRMRDTLQENIRKVDEQLKALRELRMYLLPRLEIERSTGDSRMQQEIKNQIAAFEELAGLGPDESFKPSAITGLQGLKEDDFHRQTTDLEAVNSEITRRLNTTARAQEFKTTMSLLFAVIVALVITFFFVVALRDPKVRQDIFSGQAGIQFITLFSLVIAIILFGITEVLEGKELAALLGGLAGYILGRSGMPSPSQTGQRPPNEGVSPGEEHKESEMIHPHAA